MATTSDGNQGDPPDPPNAQYDSVPSPFPLAAERNKHDANPSNIAEDMDIFDPDLDTTTMTDPGIGNGGDGEGDPPEKPSTNAPSPFPSAANRPKNDSNMSNFDEDMYFFDHDTPPLTPNKTPRFGSDNTNRAIDSLSANHSAVRGSKHDRDWTNNNTDDKDYDDNIMTSASDYSSKNTDIDDAEDIMTPRQFATSST